MTKALSHSFSCECVLVYKDDKHMTTRADTASRLWTTLRYNELVYDSGTAMITCATYSHK